MATIFNHFGKDKNAFINPWDVIERISDFPEVCITTFSEIIITDFIKQNAAKIVANLYSANGAVPVYEIEYAGKKLGLFLSRVGAPACAAGLEEIIALGTKKIIQFGSCGILNQSYADNKIILPSSAIRDEGTSYHYFPASEEIHADRSSTDIAIQCLERHKIPYVVGKIWTSDAIYRETLEIIEDRKAQGCIAVEMECSASLAVAKFRKIPIIQFFYGADNLDSDKWEPRDLTDYGASSGNKYMTIALECGIDFLKK
ncbi:MAG: nucleoside phosphorylase [Lachnospiraceae bacterium]|nr:nucleoside phosphorylase [Lachnospiraceae bacterium]